MATLNFPNTLGQPTDGSFTYIENDVIYSWNGTYWSANNATDLDNRYVNVTGDTMTGDLTVPNLESAGDIQSTSQNGGPLAGFRNQLINGGMAVNQRGLNLYSDGRANEYTVDRWFTSTGLSVSWYSDTNFMPAGFTAAIEIGVTSGQEAVINQRIEQPNAGFWAAPGSTWTLSAWVDKPDNFELNLSYRNSANTVLASFSKVGALVKGETSGIFTRVSQVFTAPAFTAGTEYTQANFANLTSGEVTRFTGAQLEPGPVATPFEQRPIGAELALCQRYYEYGVVLDYSLNGTQTTSWRVSSKAFSVTKRDLPSITTSKDLYSNYNEFQTFIPGGGSETATQSEITYSVTDVETNSFVWQSNVASAASIAAYASIKYYYYADAEL